MTEEQMKEWCLHHYCNSCPYNQNEKCIISGKDQNKNGNANY